jgi:hypothetical protein
MDPNSNEQLKSPASTTQAPTPYMHYDRAVSNTADLSNLPLGVPNANFDPMAQMPATNPHLPPTQPAVIVRSFEFRRPVVQNDYNDYVSFINSNQAWAAVHERCMAGFNSFLVQLEQLIKTQGMQQSKMVFSWSLHHGFSVQIPILDTPYAQLFLDNAIFLANQIIHGQINHQHLSNLGGPRLGAHMTGIPQVVQPPALHYQSPYSANNFSPHALSVTGRGQPARGQPQLVSPSPVQPRGRARAGTAPGARRVSLTIFLTNGNSLIDRFQGGATRSRGVVKSETAATPRKRTTPERKQAMSGGVGIQGGSMGGMGAAIIGGGSYGANDTGEGSVVKAEAPEQRATKGKKIKLEAANTDVDLSDTDAHWDNAGEGLEYLEDPFYFTKTMK